MELLKEICDKDLNISVSKVDISYKLRKASRSIVFNSKNEMALLYVSKNNYHKLPGGGIEDGEDIKSALIREVLEEVGAKIQVLGEIGMTIEYRNEFEQIQISYCYYSKVAGEIKATAFTETEKDAGFQLRWVGINEAVKILENDEPNNYVGKFINKRDLEFLKKAKELRFAIQRTN